ncbi:hypothetical protein [Rubrobacter aplysinae]|uniref:hypothetical protein n=1 Tax=Rubrobacter aplysinae TaxID=909625 RepID=UPI00069E38CC|nr:hypothetical protein [Rubrobacter aplysinae]
MKDEYPGAGSGEMERREFLKLGGAGLAGAAVIGGGFAGAGRALAQDSGGGSLRREFEKAATEYNVSVKVLIAMGYVNTRWEMPPPRTNAYDPGESEGRGTYGIMALVKNPTTDTLGDAASLTGLPEGTLKTDRAANILGGAALLAEASEPVPESLDGLTEDLAAVRRGLNGSAVAGVGAGELYVEQVIQTLQSGASKAISTGERVTLAPVG